MAPDGSRIAFASNRDGAWRIHVADADGTAVRRLTDGPGSDFAPAWTPDGGTLGFLSTRIGAAEVWTISDDGTDVRQITKSEAGWIDSFAWAPR